MLTLLFCFYTVFATQGNKLELKLIYDAFLVLGKGNVDFQSITDSLSGFIEFYSMRKLDPKKQYQILLQNALEEMDKLQDRRLHYLKDYEKKLIANYVELEQRFKDYQGMLTDFKLQYEKNDEQLEHLTFNLQKNNELEDELNKELQEFNLMIQIAFDNTYSNVEHLRDLILFWYETDYFEQYQFLRSPFSYTEFKDSFFQLVQLFKDPWNRMSLKHSHVLSVFSSHLQMAKVMIADQFYKTNIELYKRINILQLDNEMLLQVGQQLHALIEYIESMKDIYKKESTDEISLEMMYVKHEQRQLPNLHQNYRSDAIKIRDQSWIDQGRREKKEKELQEIVRNFVKFTKKF